MSSHRVGTLVGSVRKGSVNRQLADALTALAGPTNLRFENVVIDKLPMYNDDLWANPPAEVERFKAEVESYDALLFVTPEYNRSIPTLLKNAIDWGSRPKTRNSWSGRPLSIIGASMGAIGTAVAQAHLKSVMLAMDCAIMGQPEVYLAWRVGLVDEQGRITDSATEAFLQAYLARFETWINRVGAK